MRGASRGGVLALRSQTRGWAMERPLWADGALASSQAELAATRSLLANAQGQLRHNAQHEREQRRKRFDIAHMRQASYDSQARADWRQPPHAGSATTPIAVGLLLQEVRELERCSFRSPQSRA